MNLANKPVYASPYQAYENRRDSGWYIECTEGITYKEALVLALAVNPAFVQYRKNNKDDFDYYETAVDIIGQANEIIKQMELK